ncbi:c-type cytochrome [Paracoccus sp. S-4012]|uniref:c-type cytochrome n=1 Tax=Paracoccus sp. S-4012 TaxID=2665648 RepID=UPI0012AF8DDF|nr:c-type cytochrome [Paracoccus sp. S-4012]MRX52258.1 c-type cytochrome [Paracoccus sp. S-4012]
MRAGRIILAAAAVGGLATCDYFLPERGGAYIQGGDAMRGFALLETGAHGCQSCHAIPGIRAPRGVVGPPLAGMARRGFISGQLPNRTGVMVAFLRDPARLLPQTGMPDTHLTLDQARDMAAFLYTLEDPDAR